MSIFYLQIVDKRKSENDNFHQQDFKSLLDMLLDISDQNSEFTEKDVINETCTFMLAVDYIYTVLAISDCNEIIILQTIVNPN